MNTAPVDLAAIDADRAAVALKDTRFYLKPENGGHDLFIRHFAAKGKGAYEKSHRFKGESYNNYRSQRAKKRKRKAKDGKKKEDFSSPLV